MATGLDSMVVGESQILGQLRTRLRRERPSWTPVRSSLHELFQNALRVGKRAHSGDRHRRGPAQSLVSVGARSEAVVGVLGPARPAADVLIIGAGSMGALSGATLRPDAGVSELSRWPTGARPGPNG